MNIGRLLLDSVVLLMAAALCWQLVVIRLALARAEDACQMLVRGLLREDWALVRAACERLAREGRTIGSLPIVGRHGRELVTVARDAQRVADEFRRLSTDACRHISRRRGLNSTKGNDRQHLASFLERRSVA